MADVASAQTKRCTKCGEEKPFSSFYRRKDSKDGYGKWCKSCMDAKSDEWRRKHPQLARQQRRNWEKTHPGVKARYRATVKRKEYHQKYSAQWYEKNKERLRPIRQKWQQDNYLKGRKEKQTQAMANRRARIRNAQGAHSLEEVNALYIRQNSLCAACRIELHGRFHRDHIVPLVAGGSNYIDNIQLLCDPCNRLKGPRTNEWLLSVIMENRNG